MSTVLNLNRSAYLSAGVSPKTLSYLSAKYLNIRYIVPARDTFVVTQAYVANAPGIAFDYYGSQDYWWVVCLFNGILDPIEDFVPGLALQLPSLTDINAFLSLKETEGQDLTVTI